MVAPSVAPAAPVVTWDSPVADTVDDSAGDWGAGGDWATDVSSVSAPTASVPSWSAVVKKSLPPDSLPSVAPLPADAVASSSSSSCDWSVAAGFTPVELEWFDEPDPDTTVDYLTARAQEMLARYIAEGGDDDDDAEAGAGAGKGGGAEYERVPAAQKHVLKFQERLALAPSQCLRYTVQTLCGVLNHLPVRPQV